MKPMKTIVILIVVLAWLGLSLTHAGTKQETCSLKGDYLGQTPPGIEPQVFAPGFISTGLAERDTAFTPDLKEFYYSVIFDGFSSILVTKQDAEGKWSQPEIAPFSGKYVDIEPCISPDGKTFYFSSKRPLPGSTEASKVHNIWLMERKGNAWGTPRDIGAPINSGLNVYYPSVTDKGTIYFNQRLKDRAEYIYRSRLVNGKYTQPEKLGDKVNTTRAQFNAFIAPDESYLIIPIYGRKDSLGGADYYVSFRNPDDTWTGPFNLGDKINTPGNEFCPYVTRDGKYLFFHRQQGRLAAEIPSGKKRSLKDLKKRHLQWGNGNSDIYWVSTEAITKLKPKK
ncbi:MAG: hypothetical protein GY757_36425 [bacterium]|nr:hypothetical protein [bacterium]